MNHPWGLGEDLSVRYRKGQKVTDTNLTIAGDDAARDWDDGCGRDTVRNEFLIPRIASFANRYRPAHIMDVGAGTGYIARNVDTRLSYRPRWTLIDTDRSRLDVALAQRPDRMAADIVIEDLLHPASKYSRPDGDCVLMLFTLLEMIDIPEAIRKVASLVSPGGYLLIALPDVWRDIVDLPGCALTTAAKFLTEMVSIDKIDGFTKDKYPFNAIRIEAVIAAHLKAGFTLIGLDRSEVGKGTYLLTFKNLRVFPHG